jgi:hypothetical protein
MKRPGAGVIFPVYLSKGPKLPVTCEISSATIRIKELVAKSSCCLR